MDHFGVDVKRNGDHFRVGIISGAVQMSSNNETKWVKHILLKYNKYVTWCGRLSFYQV